VHAHVRELAVLATPCQVERAKVAEFWMAKRSKLDTDNAE
jgi:hypothetical protein